MNTTTITLEPLNASDMLSTHLFSAILARVDDAIRKEGITVEMQEPLMDLQRLQADVVIGLESNLPSRKPHLDLDSYAVEVIRSERARLNIKTRFSGVLEGLMNTMRVRKQFILPITAPLPESMLKYLPAVLGVAKQF